MPTEMGAEAVEIITMAIDKFQAKKNYEVRNRMSRRLRMKAPRSVFS